VEPRHLRRHLRRPPASRTLRVALAVLVSHALLLVVKHAHPGRDLQLPTSRLTGSFGSTGSSMAHAHQRWRRKVSLGSCILPRAEWLGELGWCSSALLLREVPGTFPAPAKGPAPSLGQPWACSAVTPTWLASLAESRSSEISSGPEAIIVSAA